MIDFYLMKFSGLNFKSVKTFTLRFSLVILLLLIGGKGILSEENHSHSPKEFQSVFQTQKYRIHLLNKDFTLFRPFVYKKTLPKLSPVRSIKLSYSINGKGQLDTLSLANFLLQNNPKISSAEATKIARLYIEEASAENINYDIAFSQMCLETGFLRYDGQVHPRQNNFCGLGVVGNGSIGLSFPTERMGIRAHIQHLKAYTSTASLHHKIVDSRFRFVKRGSIKSIDDLTGKWASDRHYGKKIRSLLKRLYAAKAKKNS